LLPPKPLFYQKFLLLAFFHELGHVVFNIFARAESSLLPEEMSDGVYRLIMLFRESMAEYFSIKILSDLDLNGFAKYGQDINSAYKTLKMNQDSCINKLRHIGDARHYYELAKGPSGEGAIRNNIENIIKRQKDKLGHLEVHIPFGAQAVYEYINFIESWDDEIIQRIRRLFNNQDDPKEFWDLWAHLYALGEQCYLDAKWK
jgi:hypothetical protein